MPAGNLEQPVVEGCAEHVVLQDIQVFGRGRHTPRRMLVGHMDSGLLVLSVNQGAISGLFMHSGVVPAGMPYENHNGDCCICALVCLPVFTSIAVGISGLCG